MWLALANPAILAGSIGHWACKYRTLRLNLGQSQKPWFTVMPKVWYYLYMWSAHKPSPIQPRGNGFTLVELLCVVAIITLLIGILTPAVSGAMARARSFKCQMSQRSVAFDFQIFADPLLHGNRGDDADSMEFGIETFQESQYGVDEFWRWGNAGAIELPDALGNDPMRCPDVRQPLVLRDNLACSRGAVGPDISISFGFNARLNRAEYIDSRGRARSVSVTLRPDILSHASVPLLLDVDGERAKSLGVSPVFTAPSLDSQGPYANERMWFPGLRHSGKANIAFMDGHVESSRQPDVEPGYDWSYQPLR